MIVRYREVVKVMHRSSGRGGVGNIKAPPPAEDGTIAAAMSRGRDPTVPFERVAYSTGRGGAGNINRNGPSSGGNNSGQDVLTEMPVFQNTVASRSRSQGSPQQKGFSTGRGGSGNIIRKNEQPTTSTEDRHRSVSSSRSRNGNDTALQRTGTHGSGTS
ncbi:hypothetical protein D9758_011462 [Tetrapyrgos nigripes]|uniref:Uncharacterized protein n=1 Tax=Tetrapyrgos nigripes TaxID=182062 RepID=A0A8H5CQ30_9AGAR|nr:hypothetical protein D9758_011462 [Tetrapyrgos nigripes]